MLTTIHDKNQTMCLPTRGLHCSGERVGHKETNTYKIKCRVGAIVMNSTAGAEDRGWRNCGYFRWWWSRRVSTRIWNLWKHLNVCFLSNENAWVGFFDLFIANSTSYYFQPPCCPQGSKSFPSSWNSSPWVLYPTWPLIISTSLIPLQGGSREK